MDIEDFGGTTNRIPATKCVNEKKRREQENVYMEELADLIDSTNTSHSSETPTLNTIDGSRPDKCAILEQTVRQIQTMQPSGSNSSILNSILPTELLGSLVIEALHGFMFIVNSKSANISLVSENVSEFIGHSVHDLRNESIYNYLHPGDHAHFFMNLLSNEEEETLSRHSYDSPSLKSKIFSCRFVKKDGGYEVLSVSSVRLDKLHKSESSLFCVARRVSSHEKNNYTAVELFSTKVDPSDSYNIVQVDTTGMNTIQGSKIIESLLNQSLLSFCYFSDSEVLSRHLELTLKDKCHVSQIYRMHLLGQSTYVHVQSKSRYFDGPNESFIMSQHSIIGETEVEPSELPSLRDKRKTDETAQKNQLLKDLLNANYSRTELSGSPTVSNSKILELLSQRDSSTPKIKSGSSVCSQNPSLAHLLAKPLSDSSPHSVPSQWNMEPYEKLPKVNLRTLKNKTGGTKRRAEEDVCSQNPSLAHLLSKPLNDSHITIPPPIPSKWHQEPHEKLPKNIINKLSSPPQQQQQQHPSQQQQQPSHPQQSQPLHDSIDNPDALLSDILDGVIDIQERSPSSLLRDPKEKINLSDIEEFLVANTIETTSSNKGAAAAAAAAVAAAASYQNSHYALLPSQQSSVSLVPRMNELLQGVPPNVSIPQNNNNNSGSTHTIHSIHPIHHSIHPNHHSQQIPPPPPFSSFPSSYNPSVRGRPPQYHIPESSRASESDERQKRSLLQRLLSE